MYKEYMDAQTIMFKSDSFCRAYHLKYFNEHYNIISSELTNVKEIYYKCNNSRKSWIDYRKAMLSHSGVSFIDKIMNSPKLTNEELTLLPECEYTDAYGFKHSIGPRDGLDSPSSIKSRLALKPVNFEMKLYYEMIDNERKYRLDVNFKADISNAIIIFNGCYYPYHIRKDKISVTYREEDGIDFPKKVDRFGHYVLEEDGTCKIFDPNENREYFNIIPYTWAHVTKENEFTATNRNGDWIQMSEPVDSGCLLFYNHVMYFYEVNKNNDYLIRILDIDPENSGNFILEDIVMVRFVNENKDQGALKQQKMVGLFQVDKDDAIVYFPSSVSEGILTYNGINETFLINPDKKSLRFMMPHEVYGINHNLFTTLCEGSKIYCINFYTGDLDGNVYTMPHDKLTSIANELINKYKLEAEKANRELNKLKEETRLIYPNYKDTITEFRKGEFEGAIRPYFKLKYKPIENTVKLFINGVAYKSNTYFYYHLLNGITPIIVWDYLEKDNGFDIKTSFDITAVYDVSYAENEDFDPINK